MAMGMAPRIYLSEMVAVSLACAAGPGPDRLPRTLIVPPANLAQARDRLAAGDDELRPALEALLAEADKGLRQAPVSVTDDDLMPPSGDPRDYMSVGPYWWPDPTSKDGLPYIRRDGEVNPERKRGDAVALGQMQTAVRALCLGYFLTGREDYAAHAAELLRVWFLDPARRMNPNLNYGQAIPGRTTGRGIGIIDTACLADLVDGVGLLESSPAWTAVDRAGLEAWFGAYLDWLLTSPHGKDEDKAANNHGTWYDVQVAVFALFCGRRDVAERVLSRVGPRRIATQIEADGRQPHELARTKSWSYSVMNLDGLLTLAQLGRHVEVDLWGYTSADGRSLRRALDYLCGFTTPGSVWTQTQLGGWQAHTLLPCLLVGAQGFAAPTYREAALQLAPERTRSDRHRLLYPAGR